MRTFSAQFVIPDSPARHSLIRRIVHEVNAEMSTTISRGLPTLYKNCFFKCLIRGVKSLQYALPKLRFIYLFILGGLLWGPDTSAPLVPWFVGAWYECTTCTVACKGLVRVHHLYHGLSGLVRVYHWYHGMWGLVRVCHLYRCLWGPSMSAPLVSWFIWAGTSAPLVPWFVGAWYECTTGHGLWGLVRVYHLYRGSWGPNMSAPLVPWFVGARYEHTSCTVVCGGLVRVYHLYNGLWVHS